MGHCQQEVADDDPVVHVWWLAICFVNELSVNADAVTVSSAICPSRGV